MTPTEALEAYLAGDRDCRQDWWRSISNNVSGATYEADHMSAFPQHFTAAARQQGQKGYLTGQQAPKRLVDKQQAQPSPAGLGQGPSKAELLQKLKLAQLRHKESPNIPVTSTDNSCRPNRSAVLGSRQRQSATSQRSVAFKLPASIRPQHCPADSLLQPNRLSLPAAPQLKSNSVFTVSVQCLTAALCWSMATFVVLGSTSCWVCRAMQQEKWPCKTQHASLACVVFMSGFQRLQSLAALWQPICAS